MSSSFDFALVMVVLYLMLSFVFCCVVRILFGNLGQDVSVSGHYHLIRFVLQGQLCLKHLHTLYHDIKYKIQSITICIMYIK